MPWRSILVGHVKSVHEGMKYNSYQCDHTAIQNWLRIRHKQHEHEEMKCDKCEYKTVAKQNLVRHKRYEHEGIQYRSGKFVCNQCSIPFTSSLVQFHQCSEHDYKATQQTLIFEVMA